MLKKHFTLLMLQTVVLVNIFVETDTFYFEEHYSFMKQSIWCINKIKC